MGLNTAVVILNDRLHDLEGDPAFAQQIAESIRANGRDRGLQNGYGVLPSVHADHDQVVVVGGNTIKDFSELADGQAERMLRRLAEERGFRLVRRKA